MAFVSTVVLVVASFWAVWVLFATRLLLRNGLAASPSLFAATVLFALGVIVVIATDLSSLHLLWWFVLTRAIGMIVQAYPWGVFITMHALALLVGSRRSD